VIIRYEEGATIASSLADLGKGQEFGDVTTNGAAERAVLRLLSPGTVEPAARPVEAGV
jgi:hypothetical protein